MRGPELEFLPAALEVEETAPAPAGRLVAWTIVVLFSTAVGWAWIGRVDIVATARGKIIPSGRVKRIQPLEIGVIRRIHVSEGSPVTRGQLLVELDPTAVRAEQGRLETDLAAAGHELARLRVLVERAGTDGDPLDPAAARAAIVRELEQVRVALPERQGPAAGRGLTPAPSPSGLRLDVRLLLAELSGYRSRAGELEMELKRRRAQREGVRVNIRKLERTLPLIASRAAAIRTLAERKMAGQLAFLELEQRRIEARQDLAALRYDLDEATAGIDSIVRRRVTRAAEYRRATLSKIAEAERRAGSLALALVAVDRRARLQRLTSPIDGVVEQLAVHTTGGVVTPAQELMRIVPRDRELEIEAWLANKDIGFVVEGQSVEVKVETFPFTRYGTIEGEVVNLSRDAIAREGLGLVYAARVSMRRSALRVGDRLVDLTPGMAVTVEMRIGTRRIIEFVLSPLLRGLRNAARER